MPSPASPAKTLAVFPPLPFAGVPDLGALPLESLTGAGALDRACTCMHAIIHAHVYVYSMWYLSDACSVLPFTKPTRSSFIGTVIALFTLEEFEKCLVNQQLYNKRIIQMLAERLKNQTA